MSFNVPCPSWTRKRLCKRLFALQIHHPSALELEVNQKIPVKYFGRDPVSGQHRVSSKAIFSPMSGHVKTVDAKANGEKEEESRIGS